ncbi:MAG: T9SS type A sorting domain-containing protein, partial [Fimbriimonadaceae bacterium]|nr:T9SS type A sorting domain-containing protein [Chitinophagales bacterium]
DDTLDLGYPDISYTGNYDDDIQSIIICDHTSPTTNAGMSAFFFNYDSYSERVNIYTGNSYVNYLPGVYERWGDYTGSQRKYNETGIVWVNGNYGYYYVTGGFIAHRDNATWIAKLQSSDSLPLSTNDIPTTDKNIIYPNPFEHTFITELNVPASGEMHIVLFDVQRNLVKDLLLSQVNAGKNQFQFSTQSLASGTYILKIELNGKIFSAEKVIKQ